MDARGEIRLGAQVHQQGDALRQRRQVRGEAPLGFQVQQPRVQMLTGHHDEPRVSDLREFRVDPLGEDSGQVLPFRARVLERGPLELPQRTVHAGRRENAVARLAERPREQRAATGEQVAAA
ncbi:hypothetical protein GCM10025876_20540 [Demequina litorisediminis]|uniref:Uncharacterized protein n=2 Tax=Demequina litorisediminis TaxID=1849022 RepID=A0ABQ6IEZ4_9MICO|nr:hypothetical protein GCM10025876_20540 [Demequina litorisediminis]